MPVALEIYEFYNYALCKLRVEIKSNEASSRTVNFRSAKNKSCFNEILEGAKGYTCIDIGKITKRGRTTGERGERKGRWAVKSKGDHKPTGNDKLEYPIDGWFSGNQ